MLQERQFKKKKKEELLIFPKISSMNIIKLSLPLHKVIQAGAITMNYEERREKHRSNTFPDK